MKPIPCPGCGDANEWVEVCTEVLINDTYVYDEEKKGYVFHNHDQENFGERYMRCNNCNHEADDELSDRITDSIVIK